MEQQTKVTTNVSAKNITWMLKLFTEFVTVLQVLIKKIYTL